MAKDRFNPAARRALNTLSGDPMDALVRATMARRDADTYNPRELRTDALAPQYDAMSEMDPYEPEPDGDADDAMARAGGVSPTGVRMVKEYGGGDTAWRGTPTQYEATGGYGGDPELLARIRAAIGGR